MAKQCDLFVKKKLKSYDGKKLFDTIDKCRNHKARLLNYFAIDHDHAPIQEPGVPGGVPIPGGGTSCLEASSSGSATEEGGLSATPLKTSSSPRTASSVHDPFSDWCGWHNDHGYYYFLCPVVFERQRG